MRILRERWLLFWFEPVLPLNLGVCRALFFGAFFLFYLPQYFAAWGEVSDVFWAPVPIFEAFRLPVPSGDLLAWVEGTWKAALVLSCLGLFTRAPALSLRSSSGSTCWDFRKTSSGRPGTTTTCLW